MVYEAKLGRYSLAMLNVGIQEDAGWVLAVASGRANLARLCGMADLVARVAGMNGHKRALIDLLAAEPQLSFSEHLILGQHVASVLAHLERVATSFLGGGHLSPASVPSSLNAGSGGQRSARSSGREARGGPARTLPTDVAPAPECSFVRRALVLRGGPPAVRPSSGEERCVRR